MLFNSYAFIFGYLPITLAGYLLLVRWAPNACVVWLSAASVAFYAGWNPRYVPLLLTSVVFNYICSQFMVGRMTRRGDVRVVLMLAVAVNLGVLGYYKYSNFFVETMEGVTRLTFSIGHVILPLGISFFTFTQIAFLVDLSRGHKSFLTFPKYLLFVTFFPHLVAGPILHHASIVPQFRWRKVDLWSDLEVGLTIFILGLCKKVVFADTLAKFVGPVFQAVAQGQQLGIIESWAGVVAYSLQLYFDFSGYSDMAIGLARMCGVRFPLNFASPYKAENIIEFWRRWHMTLSAFLRDYLYIPLGGNRHGPLRRYLNLMVTMVLGGLWHGASWTFVAWGALHGIYLVVNHAWQAVARAFGSAERPRGLERVVGIFTTYVAVTVAWVFFRSATFPAALSMLRAMAGLNGIFLPQLWQDRFAKWGVDLAGFVTFTDMAPTFNGMRQVVLTMIFLGIVWFLPNTQEIMAPYRPALAVGTSKPPVWWQWRPTPGWALLLALCTAVPLLWLNQATEFLYYQF
jgi:alginate O-acetyltransferase complex protein AlgI